MKNKIRKKSLLKLVLVAIMISILALGSNAGYTLPGNLASNGGLATTICGGNPPLTGIVNTNAPIYNNVTGAQSIIQISLLIMLTMLTLAAAVYSFGYAFQMRRLTEFAKVEIGEAIVTMLIIIIFIGTFNVVSAGTGTVNLFGRGTVTTQNIFISDCSFLASQSIGLLEPVLRLSLQNNIITSIGFTEFGIAPNNFGLKIAPFQGLYALGSLVSILADVAGAFILVLTAASVLLGIFYNMFPLFLYAGIILRTLPWTRAAGGAMLALFAAFYIIFPFVLHFMIFGYLSGLAGISQPLTFADVFQGFASIIQSATSFNPLATVVALINFFSISNNYVYQTIINGKLYGIANGFIYTVIEPQMYVIFSVIISFIISFDFMEDTAELLGAPSTRADNILKDIL